MDNFAQLLKEYENNPGAIHLGVEIGFYYIEKNNLEKAGEVARDLLKRAPENLEVLQLLGICYEKEGDFDKAIQCYWRAIRSKQEGSEIFWYNIGTVYSLKGQPERAKEAFDKTLYFYPDKGENPEFLTARAFPYFELGLSDESEAMLKKALKIQQDYLPALKKLSSNYFFIKRYTESLEFLEKCLKVAPGDPEIWNNMGFVLYEGVLDDSRAKDSFRQAILLRPEYDAPFFGLGLIALWRENNSDAAIEFLTTATRLNSNNNEAFKNLGVAYARKEKWRYAIHNFACAIRIDEKTTLAWYYLGRALYHKKKFFSATGALNKAIHQNINDSWAYVFLSRSLISLREYEEALRCVTDGIKNSKEGSDGWKELLSTEKDLKKFLAAPSG